MIGWIVLVPAWLAAAFLQRSPRFLLAMMVVVWVADTAAYFAGHRFGRRELAPQISPGKTWEGVLGAFAAVLVYGFAASFILLQPPANTFDRVAMVVFVAAMTVLGIVGDLFESWIKRGAGAKDSGSLLPATAACSTELTALRQRCRSQRFTIYRRWVERETPCNPRIHRQYRRQHARCGGSPF